MNAGLWNKILASYTPQKRAWEKKYPYDYYILRPISFPLTWLAAKAGLTPNQVTFLTVLISLAGCILLAQGTRHYLIAGGLLISFFNLADCIDGNLARMNPVPSKRGAFLDSIAGYPYYAAYLAAGVGLYRMGEHPLFLWAGMAALLFEMLGAHIELCYDYFSLVSAQNIQKDEGNIAGGSSGLTATTTYTVYRNLTELIAHDFLFPLTAFTGHLGLFLVASSAIKSVNFFVSLVYFVIRSKRWN
ncbi:MAG: CDP-alcohol phosphatidyltransferase family protein [bacterium]